MKRNNILLLLLSVTVILFVLLYAKLKPAINQSSTPSGRTVPYAHTDITLPSVPTKVADNNYLMNVSIQTGDNTVTAIDLLISYDPAALANVDIVPGTFFDSTQVLLKRIDAAKGQIHYVITPKVIGSGKKGTGVVAVVTFTEIGQKGAYTTVNLLPDTNAAALGQAKSVMKSSTGTVFKLE